jgi:hypothetical protein
LFRPLPNGFQALGVIMGLGDCPDDKPVFSAAWTVRVEFSAAAKMSAKVIASITMICNRFMLENLLR